jgi:hypothetical protein
MGDRSNLFIQHREQDDTWQGVGLYSHWGGLDMHDIAIKAAQDSAGRLGDPSYFTRRVLQLILKAMDPDANETGFGIWTAQPDDNEYPVLVINGESGDCWYADDETYMFGPSGMDTDVVNVRDGVLPTKPEGWGE